MKFKKSILVVAYACESDKGSEPAVGWNWTKILSNIFTDVYVITRENNVDSINEGLTKENITNVKVISYDLPNIIRKIKKKLGLTRVYYYLWQIGAVNTLNKSKIKFQVIQHITFVNDYIPSLFYKLECEKFIWGPIGSNEPIHNIFFKSIKHKICDNIKHLSKNIQRKIDFNFNKCIQRADCIIVTNNKVKNNIRVSESKVVTIPAIGIEETNNYSKYKNTDNKKIMFVGNLVDIKNPYVALEAFLKFNKENEESEFLVLGSGPELHRMKELAKKYNKIDKVKFLGRVDRTEVIKKMKEVDLVLFPTLESAGFVTLEAMSVGTPVISLNIGGPAEYLPKDLMVEIEECRTLNDVSDRICIKIKEVLINYEYYSKVCFESAKLYTWKEKEKSIYKMYTKLLRGIENV